MTAESVEMLWVEAKVRLLMYAEMKDKLLKRQSYESAQYTEGYTGPVWDNKERVTMKKVAKFIASMEA